MNDSQPRQGTRTRRHQLSEYLSANGEPASVEDLAAIFGVSPSTIRRDLRYLENSGDLVRTLGGAVRAHQSEFGWNRKGSEFASVKRAIGAEAASLTPPGAVAFIDSGTTAAEVARQLGDRSDVVAIVGGLSALIALADASPEVHVLGGRLRRPSASFLGVSALLQASRMEPTIAFLGCEFVDPKRGINCADPEQAELKAEVMRNSRETWVVVDESKLTGTAPFSFWAPLAKKVGFITGLGAGEEASDCIAQLRARKHEVLLV